eukprot:7930620-Pyramimonas_sp.AAC.1
MVSVTPCVSHVSPNRGPWGHAARGYCVNCPVCESKPSNSAPSTSPPSSSGGGGQRISGSLLFSDMSARRRSTSAKWIAPMSGGSSNGNMLLCIDE